MSRYTLGMANQYLNLGLFVVLLSFFIVLNSISSFEEEKTVSVIESLSVALIPQYSMQDKALSLHLTEEGVGRGDGDTLSQIEGAFRSIIPGVEAQKNRFGTVLRIDLDLDVFEQAMRDTSTPKNHLATVLAGLMSMPDTQRYQMDMLLSLPDQVALYSLENTADVQGLLKQVGGYAKILQDQGVDPALLSVGFEQGNAGKISLLFKPFVPLVLETTRHHDSSGQATNGAVDE